MEDLQILPIYFQFFFAVLPVYNDLEWMNAVLEETDIDCNQVLLRVEGKEILAIMETVGNLGNFAAIELSCISYFQVAIQGYDR